MNSGESKHSRYKKILILILLAGMVLCFSVVSFQWNWQWRISFIDMSALANLTHFEYVEASLPGSVVTSASNTTRKIPATLQEVKSSCPVLLDGMLNGHWQLKNYTAKELEEVEIFVARTRTYHKLPTSLEREDKKCGNVNFPGTNWHRAVCNPKGATPCCMNNFCVNKSVHECQCPECLDMRSRIHAELAMWVPKDQNCKMKNFVHIEDVCHVLHNKTLYFIGDSFIRQLYTSLLELFRLNQNRSLLRDDVSQADVTKCDKYYTYFAECGGLIIRNITECKNTVRVYSQSLWRSHQASEILKHVETLIGRKNSWFIFGIGIHENLNDALIKSKVLDPIFRLLHNSTWPKIIWLAVHSPGLLKTHLHPQQQTANILRYNSKMKGIMDSMGIPVLDFFELTKGTMSYDGSHYGKGVNDAKIQILLNFLKEQNSFHKNSL